MVWSLADWVENLIEKKRPSLLDSDMVTGRLSSVNKREIIFVFDLAENHDSYVL